MNVTEVLQFTDELVFSQTGKHLDDTQEVVVKGVWDGKTYEEIAEECNRSERHIRDVGYKLWQILSKKLGEDIHKSNFHSTFERLKSSHCNTQQVVNIGINSNINLYPHGSKIENSISVNTEDVHNHQSAYHDLTLAPQIIHFYNRETELEKLSNWIINQNTRLISVLGLSGMGKTTLVKRFIDLNLQQFEIIIWRSLKFPKSLDLLLDDLLNICEQETKETTDDKLRQFLDVLINKKCLIILDDVQNIFISGQFSGQYQTEYNNYQNLFKMITEVEHQSSLILMSQEQCSEMHCLDEELYSIKCLELLGVENIEILRDKGLKDEDNWLDLITLYEGNPVYLKDIARLIKDVFSGNVAEFLAENSLVITKDMQSYFSQLFNRLSQPEQQIILELSKFDHPISREDLRQSLNSSSTDFINGLQSLQDRYLIQQINEEKVLFNLFSVFREYVINYYRD